MESWAVLVFLLPGVNWIKHCVKCVALLKRSLIFLVWLSSSDWLSGVYPQSDWVFDHSVTSLCWSWAHHSHVAFSQGPVLPGAPLPHAHTCLNPKSYTYRSHTFNCCFLIDPCRCNIVYEISWRSHTNTVTLYLFVVISIHISQFCVILTPKPPFNLFSEHWIRSLFPSFLIVFVIFPDKAHPSNTNVHL